MTVLNFTFQFFDQQPHSGQVRAKQVVSGAVKNNQGWWVVEGGAGVLCGGGLELEEL